MSGTNRTKSSRRKGAHADRSGPQPPARGRGESSSRPDRGQTTLDFAIGVTIFLSAMMFTFAFVPGILSPFTESGQQNTVTVDRVADHLSQDMLGSPDQPYVLDRSCTVAFFDGSSPSDCRWESGTLNEKLGIGKLLDVNVTITGNVTDSAGSSQVYWDEDTHEFTQDSSDGEVTLATGQSPPASSDATVSAQRVASLHGQDVKIRVVIW